MATVEQLQIAYDNQISAGADAATASLNRLADAHDRVAQVSDATDQVIRRSTPTLDSLAQKYDGDVAAMARHEAASRRLQVALDVVAAAEVKAGGATNQTTQLRERANKQYDLDVAAADKYGLSIEQRFGQGAAAVEKMGNSSRATTALIREGTRAYIEMAAGLSPLQIAAANFGNIEHLTERFGGVVKQALDFITSPTGLVIAAGAAVLAFGVAAESAESRVSSLRNTLSLVRDDYVATAAAADQAAKHLASTSFLGTADARSGINAVFGNPAFQGTPQQAEGIARAFGDLSEALGETATDWNRLRDAMNDPAALMQKLQDQNHLIGVNQALVDQTKNLQASGDKAAAFGIALTTVVNATQHVVDNKTPLEKSLNDLKNAFTDSGQSGHSFAEAIGKPITDAAAGAVGGIAALITKVNELRDRFPAFNPGGAIVGSVLGPLAPLAQLLGLGAPGAGSGASSAIDVASRIYGSAGVFSPSLATASVAGTLPGAPAYDVSQMASIVEKFVTAGMQLDDAVAYAANGMRESGGLWNGTPGDNGASHGLMQWQKDRLTAFQSANGGMLPEQTSLDAQIAFVLQENAGLKSGVYGSVRNASGVAAKAGLVTYGYENPADPATQARISAAIANDFMTKFGGTASGGAAIDVNGGSGLTNATTGVTKLATDYAKALGVAGEAAKTAQQKVGAFNAALKLDPGNQEYLDGLQKATLEYYNAIAPAQALIRSLDLQTAGERQIADAWKNGSAAAQLATIGVKARTEALQFAAPTDANYATIVQAIADAHVREAAAQQAVAAGQQSNTNSLQIQYLQTELATLGETDTVRNHILATLKAQQDVQTKFPLLADAEKQKLVEEATRLSDLQTQLQQNQQALNEIGNLATQAFDQVGNAITQAFVGGQGAAVNFGNVARAVISSVLQEVIKLAIINPILNAAIGGTNRTTLDQALSALGGSGLGGTTAGASSPLSFSNLSSVAGLATNSTLLNGLGLTGPNGLLGNLGLSGSNGILSSIGTFLNGSAGAASPTATTAALNALGGQFGPETATQYLAAGGTPVGSGSIGLLNTSVLGSIGSTATIGTLFSGVGLGSAVGGLVNGQIGGNSTNGTVGALSGAAAGALIGSVVPVIGTIIGGLIGGLLGGVGGGLIGQQGTPTGLAKTLSPAIDPISALLGKQSNLGLAILSAGALGFLGPGPAHSFSTSSVALGSDGRLDLGALHAQMDPNAGAQHDQAMADVNALNAFLDSVALKLTSLGGLKEIGDNTPGDPTAGHNGKFSDLNSAAAGFRFTAPDDSILNTYLSGKSYPDLTTFQNDVSTYETLINTTIPAMTAQAKVTGTLNDAIAQVTAQFAPAIATAQQYGVATDSLTQAQSRAIQTLSDAASFRVADEDLTVRFSNATSTGLGPALFSFDLNAQRQRDQFSQQLVAVYGDVFKDTQGYADQMALLERTLGAERVQIQQQYNDQLTQTATTTVSNIASYALKLQSGPLSPLSPQSMLALARSQFSTDAMSAANGNFNALSQLTSYSDAYLSSARTVYGSGTGYDAAFQAVTAALTQSLAVTPETLTAAVFQNVSETNTQKLADLLSGIQSQLSGIKTAMNQNGSKPAQIAA